MRAKSYANIAAANFLVSYGEGVHCNASIHCSYYATLQCMRYILNHLRKGAIPYKEQRKQGKISSHEFVFDKILNNLECPPKVEKRYKELFRALKKKRETADYELETFPIEDCLDCESNAKEIIRILENCFRAKIA